MEQAGMQLTLKIPIVNLRATTQAVIKR
jgi:hypothetical protein